MDQMMKEQFDGNDMDGQLQRRFIEINRQLARAVIYGIRGAGTASTPRSMGGILSFLASNITNVGGALTVSAIDALILKIVLAGGNPKIITLSPYQKQKLDALDANKQMLGKRERTGGNLITNTWQSGVLDHELEVVVDKTLLTDQLLILDDEMLEVLPYANNGKDGRWKTLNASTPGKDGEKQVIRGKFTTKVHNEKAHGYLYGLT